MTLQRNLIWLTLATLEHLWDVTDRIWPFRKLDESLLTLRCFKYWAYAQCSGLKNFTCLLAAVPTPRGKTFFFGSRVTQFSPSQGLLCCVFGQDTFTCISVILGLSSGWLLQARSVFGREIWSAWPVSVIDWVQKCLSFSISPQYHCVVHYSNRGFNKDTLPSFLLKHLIKLKLDIDCLSIAGIKLKRISHRRVPDVLPSAEAPPTTLDMSPKHLTRCEKAVSALADELFILTNSSINSVLDIWRFNLKISRITRELCPTLEN